LGENPEESGAGTLEEEYKDNIIEGVNHGGDSVPEEARGSSGNKDPEARSEDQTPGIRRSQRTKKRKKPIVS